MRVPHTSDVRRQWRVLLGRGLCAACLGLAGCQRPPMLLDTLGVETGGQQLTLWGHDVREIAPIMVVGLVRENKVIAKHVAAVRFPDVYLDLHEVRCNLEEVVKGSLVGAEVKFYYFADGKYRSARPDPIYKRFFEAEVGGRYLFFLTRDRQFLRSIADVGPFSVRVWSGTHIATSGSGSDIGRRVSEIMLVPGPGANLSVMAAKLLEYREIADVWGSRLFTVQLLRRLGSLSEPMRSQACGALVTFYLGQGDCLTAIAEDPAESSDNRREASREILKWEPFQHALIKSLADPAQLGFLDAAGDSRLRIREEFETILLGSDAVLRAEACRALSRYYPWDPEPACSGKESRPK